MGKDGDTTISALKGATQINSNSLFDHGAGTPNVVRMSDFLIDAIGNRIEDTGGATYEQNIPVVGDPGKMYPGVANDIQSFRVQVSQANLNNPGAQGGDGGRFFYEQILLANYEITAGTLQGWDALKNDPSTDDFLNFEVTIRAENTNGVGFNVQLTSLNGDATNSTIVSGGYANVATDPQAAVLSWSQSSGVAEATYYDPDDDVDLDYVQINTSSSLTSPSGQVNIPSTESGTVSGSLTWDPSQRQISGDGNIQATFYNQNGNVAPNGSINAPSSSSGSYVDT